VHDHADAHNKAEEQQRESRSNELSACLRPTHLEILHVAHFLSAFGSAWVPFNSGSVGTHTRMINANRSSGAGSQLAFASASGLRKLLKSSGGPDQRRLEPGDELPAALDQLRLAA
jgi:hypothetical protein